MIHDTPVSTDTLLQVTGFEREGDLKRMFDQCGIRWFPGKGGRPWTTMALINQAGGLFGGEASGSARPLSPDDI